MEANLQGGHTRDPVLGVPNGGAVGMVEKLLSEGGGGECSPKIMGQGVLETGCFGRPFGKVLFWFGVHCSLLGCLGASLGEDKCGAKSRILGTTVVCRVRAGQTLPQSVFLAMCVCCASRIFVPHFPCTAVLVDCDRSP